MSAAIKFLEQSSQERPAPDFAKLMGAQCWANLHPAIRRRFSNHKLRVRYSGDMHIHSNFVGTIFALLTAPFGCPLPWVKSGEYPAYVDVYPDPKTNGVVWRRTFLRKGRKKPVHINSVKRLADNGRLIECVRSGVFGGIGMELALFEKGGALCFASRGYFLRWGRVHLPIPIWFTPGKTLVEHIDQGGEYFRFRLTITHPWFGQTIHQEGVFRDPDGGAI